MKSSRTPSSKAQRDSLLKREADLVQGAFERIRGWSEIRVAKEVPSLGRCVDLVYLERGIVVAVEFKMNDWRRALRQARDHRLAADYVYVCMPAREIPQAMWMALAQEGIGLLFYSNEGDWPFSMALKAPQSSETWKVARAWLRDYVKAQRLPSSQS